MENEFEVRNTEVSQRIYAIPMQIPAQRVAFRQGFSFSKEPFESQLPTWNHIWKNADSLPLRLHAYLFLEQYITKKELHKAIWATAKSWQDDIDDWGLCDALAKINTKVLESFPDEVYGVLAKWNKDKDLWKRRQSVVSLLYYSRTKKVYLPFEQITALITPMLADKEYYVQKGVGWSLRELHSVYPKDALRFFQEYIKELSPIAFTIAIEKLSAAEKEYLKSFRKK